MNNEMLTIKEVTGIVPMSIQGIYRLIKAGDFPRPVKFGRKSFWVAADVHDWMKKRLDAREKPRVGPLDPKHPKTLAAAARRAA